MDSNKRLQEYEEILNDKRKEELVKTSTEVTTAVLKAKSNRQIHVSMFKTYYADYFKAKFNNEDIDTEIDRKKFSEWMYISGGPFKEVDLLDNDKNVVDTVPSYFLQPKAPTIVDDADSLVDEFMYYNKKKDFHNKAATNRLTQKVDNTTVKANTDLDKKKHLHKWLEVIDKYSNKINMEVEDVSKKDLKKIPKDVKSKLAITEDIVDDFDY